GYRGHRNEQTFRSCAGHARHAAAENSGSRADERFRRESAIEAGVRRRLANERWIAVPSAAQTGTRGLDYSGMEDVRARTAREILFADAAGPATAWKRNRELEQAFERYFASHQARTGVSV